MTIYRKFYYWKLKNKNVKKKIQGRREWNEAKEKKNLFQFKIKRKPRNGKISNFWHWKKVQGKSDMGELQFLL